MGIFNNDKDIWEKLRSHTDRFRELDNNLTSLKKEVDSLKAQDIQILKEMESRFDSVIMVDMKNMIDNLNDKLNKRCSDLDYAVMLNNTSIRDLKNTKPIDVKGIVEPSIKELNDRIEGLNNRINLLDNERVKLLNTLNESKSRQEPLTEKQQAILDKKKEGKNVKEIAEEEGISLQAVYTTIKAIKLKGYDV